MRRYACFVTCICGTAGEMAYEFQVAAGCASQGLAVRRADC